MQPALAYCELKSKQTNQVEDRLKLLGNWHWQKWSFLDRSQAIFYLTMYFNLVLIFASAKSKVCKSTWLKFWLQIYVLLFCQEKLGKKGKFDWFLEVYTSKDWYFPTSYRFLKFLTFDQTFHVFGSGFSRILAGISSSVRQFPWFVCKDVKYLSTCVADRH